MYRYLLLMTLIVVAIVLAAYIAIVLKSPQIEISTHCTDKRMLNRDLPVFVLVDNDLYVLGSIGGRLWYRSPPLFREAKEVEFILYPSYLRYKRGSTTTTPQLKPPYVEECTIYLLSGDSYENITLTYTYIAGDSIRWGPPRELLVWGKKGEVLIELIERQALSKLDSCNFLLGGIDRLVVDIETFKSLMKIGSTPTSPQPLRYSFALVILLKLDGSKIPLSVGNKLISMDKAVKDTVSMYINSSSYNLTIVNAMYNTYENTIVPSFICTSINYVTTISPGYILRGSSLLIACSTLLIYDYKRNPKIYRMLFARFKKIKDLAKRLRRRQ